MALSSTRTASFTSTATKVMYVTRKVQADFLAILDTYGYFQESYAQDIIADVRVFLDEEVIDHVKFIWLRAGCTHVLEELEYSVIMGSQGLADDRPGGITYRPELAQANFRVRVIYNKRWQAMDKDERASIRSRLRLTWSAGEALEYGVGTWAAERTYSRGDYGLVRKRFVS